MRKDFYVFRHGETDLNRQKRWQGSGMDHDLNQNGRAQAESLMEKLAGKGIEIVFSSPLLRAKHTAEALGRALDVPVIVKPELRECFYGDAEGKLISDLQREVPEVVNNWNRSEYWDIRFPNGESKKEALDRVWSELENLTAEPYRVMGVAIHGGTMAAMLNRLHYEFEKLANCAVFHLVYEDGKWSAEGQVF